MLGVMTQAKSQRGHLESTTYRLQQVLPIQALVRVQTKAEAERFAV